MSIYDKPISAITTDDLNELIADNAIENLRLEFKSQDPTRDKTLKELSAFANTYGGYLIVGALDGSNGRLESLPGIEQISGYKQKLVQWCQVHVSPPLQVFVSNPISTPDDPSKVCYVVYVEESIEAPHFLNSRKGIYVRTDEHSARFEPRLATYDELLHLQNRRQLTIERKSRLIQRTNKRIAQFLQNEKVTKSSENSEKNSGIFKLFLCPQFPAKTLLSQPELVDLTEGIDVKWRNSRFPNNTKLLSQHESAVILYPTAKLSFFECSVWGHLCYALAVEEAVEEDVFGIRLNSFIGHLLVFLNHAHSVYEFIGFDGMINVQINLENIRKVPVFAFHGRVPIKGPSSPLDDRLEFSLNISSEQIRNNIDLVATDLLEAIFFALNWRDVATDKERIKGFIKLGYEYNFWR